MADPALAARVAAAAVRRGRFTLRSGRTSTWYVDKYAITTQPDLLRPVAAALGERIRAVPGGFDRLAGAELGAVPLVAAVSLAVERPGIFVRNQAKGYGTKRQVEGALEAGERVVLLEDVATTGGQALEAAEVLREAGAEIPLVLAVLDRQEGARERIEQAGLAFAALFTREDLGIEDESEDV